MKSKEDKVDVKSIDEIPVDTVLFRAVRIEGGVEVSADEALSPTLFAALLSAWLGRDGVSPLFKDALISVASSLVEERLAAERIARWGRGFRTKDDEIS